jgi:hypothetical protein
LSTVMFLYACSAVLAAGGAWPGCCATAKVAAHMNPKTATAVRIETIVLRIGRVIPFFEIC